jgi:hypothetical protein
MYCPVADGQRVRDHRHRATSKRQHAHNPSETARATNDARLQCVRVAHARDPRSRTALRRGIGRLSYASRNPPSDDDDEPARAQRWCPSTRARASAEAKTSATVSPAIGIRRRLRLIRRRNLPSHHRRSSPCNLDALCSVGACCHPRETTRRPTPLFHPAARRVLAQHDVELDGRRFVVLQQRDGVVAVGRVVDRDHSHVLRRHRVLSTYGLLRARVARHGPAG